MEISQQEAIHYDAVNMTSSCWRTFEMTRHVLESNYESSSAFRLAPINIY